MPQLTNKKDTCCQMHKEIKCIFVIHEKFTWPAKIDTTLKWKNEDNVFQENKTGTEGDIAFLICDKIDFELKLIRKDK